MSAWHQICINGHTIVTPLTPAAAAALDAAPVGPPADLANRLNTFYRRLTQGIPAGAAERSTSLECGDSNSTASAGAPERGAPSFLPGAGAADTRPGAPIPGGVS